MENEENSKDCEVFEEAGGKTPLLDENQCNTDNMGKQYYDNFENHDASEKEEMEDHKIGSSNSILNKSNCSLGFDQIEGVSDISDDDFGADILEPEEEPAKCNKKSPIRSANGQTAKSTFKKITRNTRERNYRDKAVKRKPFVPHNKPDARNFRKPPIEEKQPYYRFDKRKEIVRYNVRNIVSNRKSFPQRNFSMSRSRSPSFTPHKRMRRSHSRSPSPINYRNTYRRTRSRSRSRTRLRSSRSHSRSHSPSLSLSPQPSEPRRFRYRSKSPSFSPPPPYRSRSPSVRKQPKKRSKKQKNRRRKATPSPSMSISPSLSRSPSPPPLDARQIINNTTGLPTENLKVILKNSEALLAKRKSKKNKKEKRTKKKPKEIRTKRSTAMAAQHSSLREEIASKEVFASGNNILVSVSFNNSNNNETSNIGNEHSSNININNSNGNSNQFEYVAGEEERIRSRKRTVSPVPLMSVDESDVRRRRKKKARNRKESAVPPSEPPPPIVVTRKSDMKPVAIIDLDKSPIKVISTPKDVIILSDSDPENKKLKEKQNQISMVEAKTPDNTPPASPPHSHQQTAKALFSFQLKPKLQALPFNLLHDQAEEDEEKLLAEETAATNQNNQINKGDETQEVANVEKPKSPDAYDPFEPTKSGSNTPSSTPPRTNNDVTSSSDMLLKSKEMQEKLSQQETTGGNLNVNNNNNSSSINISNSLGQKAMEDGLITSSKKPCTPPMPASPSPNMMMGSEPSTATQQIPLEETDGKMDSMKKNQSEIPKSPYSPSSDDYNDVFDSGPMDPATPPPPISGPSTYIDTTSVVNLSGKGGISSYETMKMNIDYDSPSKSNPKALKLTASTLKSFNSMRSNLAATNVFTKMGLNYIKKNEINVFERKSPAVGGGTTGVVTNTQTTGTQFGKRTNTNTTTYTRTRPSRFSKPIQPVATNDNSNRSPPFNSRHYRGEILFRFGKFKF